MSAGALLNKHTISVVIPTADRPALLKRAVCSVESQSVKPDKIVIVDNGIDAVGADFAGMSVDVLRTAPMLGPGKARNTGAAACDTTFIAFLDDDDYWDTGYIGQALRKFSVCNADVVVGGLYKRAPDNSLAVYKLFPDASSDQRAVFFKNPGFGGINITINRKVFTGIGGYDETMPSSEDRDLAARLLAGGYTIVSEPRAVAVVCDHAGPRARRNQLRGNLIFIGKHWRHMRFGEKYQALRSVCRQCLCAMTT